LSELLEAVSQPKPVAKVARKKAKTGKTASKKARPKKKTGARKKAKETT
jgi:hypothetical protein